MINEAMASIPILTHYEELLGESPIMSASIRATRQCNLHCPHCYVYSSPEAGEKLSSELSLVV
jgi:MoaA/NifB/PqqE/SkfB family radical SAM enzyme